MTTPDRKHIVVTGVSTGIGHALATALVAAGYTVYGSVRKQQDADRLKEQLGAQFCPLLFDVTDQAGIAKAADQASNYGSTSSFILAPYAPT